MSNISSELTLKSEDNIVEYVYYEVTEDGIPEMITMTKTDIAIGLNPLANALAYSLGAAISESDLKSFDVATFKRPDNDELYIPLIKYGAGNTMCFEMSYQEPMSAGKQTKFYATGWFMGNTNRYFTKAIKYTDDMGFTEKARICIYDSNNVTLDTNLPVINSASNPNMKLDNYYMYKQPNEIFALNYELAFLPHDSEKDFIGSAFIENNYLMNRKAIHVGALLFKYSQTNTIKVADISILASQVHLQF